MFRLSIPQASYTDHFDTKDALIARLEQEQTKCVMEELSVTCLLNYINDQGESLEAMEVHLPIFERQLMDEVLMNFGNQKPKKLPLSSKTKVATPKGSPRAEQSTPTRTIKKTRIPFLFLTTGLSIIAVILSCLVYTRVQTQEKAITHLTQILKQEQELTIISRKLDVFCRYFIPNYFSGNTASLDNFRKKGEWVAQTGTVQSVILESINLTKKGYQVGYVINTQRDGATKRAYIRLEIEKDEKGTFGFSIVAEPIISDYPTKE
ncbi:hypothetical protein [Streptococcus ruminantium]|uniref:hypothetical protein n=1 Tax=Streptococcus ruminantium TaxID=1917441 RepID=UPI0012DD7080|nr:hypothetical protein [Streptococcus ruminantium]